MPMIHPTDREQRTTWRWRAELLVRRGDMLQPRPTHPAQQHPTITRCGVVSAWPCAESEETKKTARPMMS